MKRSVIGELEDDEDDQPDTEDAQCQDHGALPEEFEQSHGLVAAVQVP